MPIYTFKCINCKKEIEKLCKINESHPRCECGFVMTKVPSVPGSFELKGPGFYKNDYKGK
jgi:putative FmdB family regulatory protein